GMGLNELQVLLAHAASPKVRPESVSIAKSSLQQFDPLANAKPGLDGNASGSDFTWLYWLGGGGVALIFLMLMLGMRKSRGVSDEELQETHRELAQLRDLAYQQQTQLQATQQQTQMLLEAQRQAPTPAPLPSGTAETSRQITGGGLEQILAPTLDELREAVST